ncbi:MAG: helix-turn-helix domain-containing protein [Thermoleophilia bacterium]|nr:helix-turn-helix domain-containing protein [Thermoleophilia bacterium]
MTARAPTRVTLVALPEAMPSTLLGLHDSLSFAGSVPTLGTPIEPEPFTVEIAAERAGGMRLASGVPLDVPRSLADVEATDLVLIPSLLAPAGRWERGRYPELVEWIAGMHQRGALLASACSGLFPLAETGLLDDRQATIHWGYARGFRERFPRVGLQPERVLVVSGDRAEIVSSGASTSWHDLALYLIARRAGAAVAQAVAHFMAFQWHTDGLAPYAVFDPPADHGDAVIAAVQRWIAGHVAIAQPAEEMRRRSGLPARTFARRFGAATGHSPIAYVQRLRVEDAKRRLERTDTPVERIAWEVGYEDPAAFRRLFRRIAGVSPGVYRRRFQVPEYARPPAGTPS